MFLKPMRLSKACLLVLDSDADRRAALCRFLAGRGYRLADGIDAADVRTDLVLASVGRSGSTQAMPLPPACSAPVIALVDHAAWRGFDFLDMANELGAVAVLQRPFSHAALLRLIASVLMKPSDIGVNPGSWEDERADLRELLLQLENPYPA